MVEPGTREQWSMESRTDDVAARLLRCPVGCVFLLTIERDEVPIELAVTPPQAFARAAIALDALNPWSADFERTVAAALSRGADLASLARAVVTHPQSRWWTAPMDPTRQLLVIDDTAHPTSARTVPPASNVRWGVLPQRPVGWRITSTLWGAYSCVDTAIASGVGDWTQVTSHRRFAAEIDESARVFEVSGPADWHTLCVSFPRVNQHPNSPAGIDTLSPGLGPCWHAVERRPPDVHGAPDCAFRALQFSGRNRHHAVVMEYGGHDLAPGRFLAKSFTPRSHRP